MRRIDTALPGVCIIEPKVFSDSRGFFLESYNTSEFAKLGIERTFVQDNHSRSQRGVLRGLHYQFRRPQAKLARVVLGEVFDVAVDIRRGSPTFGKYEAVLLSAENKRMIYVPEGFAHGFLVMSEVAEFIYKCSDYYAPQEDRGIAWNDPDLAIPWPIPGMNPSLSDKDRKHPPLSSQPDLPTWSVDELS
jgi:dTDP-4-dehydrorhamnose 3,5-epimerase